MSGRGGSDVGSREGLMENSIIMRKKFVSKFKQNDRENVIIESACFVYLILSQEYWTSKKVKVMLTLEQAIKAQRGSRGIAILFL
jgi:hypothetical protein